MVRTAARGWCDERACRAAYRMPIIDDADFKEWERTASPALRADPLWTLHSYRVAMFAMDRAVADIAVAHKRGADPLLCDQLTRALASVAANIAEGFGRPTATDRGRFIGYAIGSVREGISWYLALAPFLPPAKLDERLNSLSELRRLLLGYARWLRTHTPRLRLA